MMVMKTLTFVIHTCQFEIWKEETIHGYLWEDRAYSEARRKWKSMERYQNVAQGMVYNKST